jgi:hypothetical protein
MLNSYSYARNNPLVLVDQNGEWPSWSQVKTVAQVGWSLGKSYVQNKAHDVKNSYNSYNAYMATPEAQQKSRDAVMSGMVYAGPIGGADRYVGFGVGSINSVGGSVAKVAPGLQLGQGFGKLGTVIENAPGKITGVFTRSNGDEHALGRILNRGASIDDIASTVYNPLVRLQQAGDNTLYLSRQAVVVLNKTGQIVTTYGAKEFGSAVKNVLSNIK